MDCDENRVYVIDFEGVEGKHYCRYSYCGWYPLKMITDVNGLQYHAGINLNGSLEVIKAVPMNVTPNEDLS